MYSPIEALKFNWSSEAVYLCFYIPFKRNPIPPNPIRALRPPMFLLVSAKKSAIDNLGDLVVNKREMKLFQVVFF